MLRHVKLLGWLYIALGVFGLLGAFVAFVAIAMGGWFSGDLQAIGITSGVAIAVASFITLLSLPGIIAGMGLLRRRPWARWLTLILGALNVFNFPFGTALAVYTFWVLLKEESTEVFTRQRAAV